MSRTENLVVMFTDIVGFTELTASQSREENEKMLLQNEKILNGVAKQFGGKRIKSIGDALLIVFKSPTDAVHCAMAMHDALWEYNLSVKEEQRVSIRVALNSGEVRIVSSDVFGEPVNVASRLEGITPANEVYFTESIYLSMNKAEVGYELVGKKELRGIPDEVTVYRVPRGVLAPRLIAITDEDEANGNKYPYGGMHKIEKPKGMKMSFDVPWKKVFIGFAAIALLTAVIKFWPENMGSKADLADLAAIENIEELESKVDERLDSDAEDVTALFMRGHINIDKGEYQAGLADYQAALEIDPKLSDDERYAENMIASLSENGPKVTELVQLSPSGALVDKLAERSVSAGKGGRRDAAYILRVIDRKDRIDVVAMAMLDLQESDSCEDKLKAVEILQDEKDPRALPVLKQSIKTNLVGMFKKNCLRKPVKKAISEIESANN